MRKRLGLIGLLLCIALMSAVSVSYAGTQASGPSFTFAVFGDNRPATSGGAPPLPFREVLKAMSAFDPVFAVNTGDCIYGSADAAKLQTQYQEYTDTVKSLLDKKVYLAIGNHEIQGGKTHQAFFEKQLGSLYYSFDQGDAHFIVLDSEMVGQTERIIGDQLEWLKQDLYKSRAARFRFVFLHEPLYPVDGHRGSSMDRYVKERDALHSLFVRHHITAVFAGHEHLFNAQKKNGVVYIITGGGGAPTYPSTEGGGDFTHFVLVSITGDRLEMKVVKPTINGKAQEILPVSGFLTQ
jgi:3',5'-cyclic AMP phosphodiesterase CpdA